MPTALVSDSGAVLYYEDTGPPANSTNYTTVVLSHGLIFHGGTFHRMIPYAAANNLRLVFLNIRDYPGSSPYSKAELEAFESDDEAVQDEAIRDLGRQFAVFLALFAKNNNIPPVTSSGGQLSGGISLLTWSMSNLVAISMLAHADTLPEETRTLLDQYLRSVVFYDASIATLGVSPTIISASPSTDTPTSVLYSPLRDQALPFAERIRFFLTWVSTYYTRVDDLATLSPEAVVSRTPLDDPTKSPTIQQLTPEQIEASADFGVLERSHDSIRRIMPQIYWRNFRRALGIETQQADGRGGEKLVWPGTKVVAIWCDMSMGDSVWAAKTINDLINQKGDEKIRRPLALRRFEHAHHFIHWDEPERFLKFLSLEV